MTINSVQIDESKEFSAFFLNGSRVIRTYVFDPSEQECGQVVITPVKSDVVPGLDCSSEHVERIKEVASCGEDEQEMSLHSIIRLKPIEVSGAETIQEAIKILRRQRLVVGV